MPGEPQSFILYLVNFPTWNALPCPRMLARQSTMPSLRRWGVQTPEQHSRVLLTPLRWATLFRARRRRCEGISICGHAGIGQGDL